MEYEAAPLEGITDAVYRRIHAAMYPGADRYYTPFISPTQHHIFTPRQLRELAPENNPGVTLVPQLLGRNADDLLWASRELESMGYGEFDLNLGCPSATVTAKRKGAGLLAFPEELDALLDALFASSPLAVSVKTRIGTEDPAEFERILSIYERYPIRRLIIHPRTRRAMYDGAVHLDVFRRAAESTRLPLSYNGDLRTVEDVRALTAELPVLRCVMIGRGVIADPALFLRLRGKAPAAGQLRRFHDALSEEYVRVFGERGNAMHRMKAIWHYLLFSIPEGDSFRKRLGKTRRWEDFQALCHAILDESGL